MKTKIFILSCIIVVLLVSCVGNKKDASNKKEGLAEKTNREIELLSEKYGIALISSRDAMEIKGIPSKEFYRNALELYNKNDFLGAISEVEEALSLYIYAPYYYLYGLCFMEIQNYENAEKAFNKALYFMDNINYEISYAKDGYLATKYAGVSIYTETSELYTYDENDNPREKYFALYNLACIYSIKMELEKSLEFLIEAIKNGYPYIDRLLADADLNNLFESNSNIKSEILSIYQNGFINDFSGKIYEYMLLDYAQYRFKDDSNIEIYQGGDVDRREFYGTYEIKNYLILVYLTKETWVRGFENDINRKDIISVVYVKSGGRWEEWKEAKERF